MSSVSFIAFLCLFFGLVIGAEDTFETSPIPQPYTGVKNYMNPCDTKKNCTLTGTICLNGKCVCGPGRAYQSGRCRHMSNCLDFAENVCEDPNRYCKMPMKWFRIGSCLCKDGFIEDPITKACRPICSFKTIKERPCADIDGENSICNVYRCQCKPNFRRNATGHCEAFECSSTSNCWSDGDVYRTCRNGTCICEYDLDPLTLRCTIKFTSIFKFSYYSNWHAEKLLLCTIIITPLVFYYCVVQNFRKAKSTIVAYKAPKPGDANFQPITIHAMAAELNASIKKNYGTDVEGGTNIKKIPSNGSLDKKNNKDNFKYERFN